MAIIKTNKIPLLFGMDLDKESSCMSALDIKGIKEGIHRSQDMLAFGPYLLISKEQIKCT